MFYLLIYLLKSGGKPSSFLHVCRSVCRRAERSIAPLFEDGTIDESAFRYVNRLSDFLFVAARYIAKKEGKKETIYKKPRSLPGENQSEKKEL